MEFHWIPLFLIGLLFNNVADGQFTGGGIVPLGFENQPQQGVPVGGGFLSGPQTGGTGQFGGQIGGTGQFGVQTGGTGQFGVQTGGTGQFGGQTGGTGQFGVQTGGTGQFGGQTGGTGQFVQPQPQPQQQPPPPPPSRECCIAMPPASRVDCGFPGITEQTCLSRGCCYIPDPQSVWCYSPPPITQNCQAPAPTQPPPPPPITTAAPVRALVPPQCQIEKSTRISCGTGVTRNQCFAKQCCFDDQATNDPKQCYISKSNGPTPAPAAKQEKGECVDKTTTCLKLENLCQSSKTFKEDICRKTCKSCIPKAATKPPRTEPPPPPITAAPRTVAPPTTGPVVTQPQPIAPPCKDDFPLACKTDEMKKSCNDPKKKDEMALYCAFTCGFCPKAPPKGCKDKYPDNCQKLKSTCTTGEPKNIQSMRKNCPVTCNACAEVAGAAPTPTPTTPFEITLAAVTPPYVPAAGECADRVQFCETALTSCKDQGPGGDAMRENCAKTCGTCPSQTKAPVLAPSKPSPTVPAVAEPECKDRVTYCEKAVESCKDTGEVGVAMRENCEKTCGMCGKKATQAPFRAPVSPTLAVLQMIENSTPTPKPAVAGACVDKIDNCAETISLCSDPGAVGKLMVKSCQRSCGNCSPRSPRLPIRNPSQPRPVQPRGPIPNQPRPASQTSCKNDLPNTDCEGKKYLCSDSNSYWPQLCRRTCNTCGKVFEFTDAKTAPAIAPTIPVRPIINAPRATPRPVSSTCKDLVRDCPNHPELCNQPQTGWPTTCRRTCNTCGQNLTPPSAAPRPATPRIITPTPRIITPSQRPVVVAPAIPSCRNKLLECDQFKYLCEDANNSWKVDCPVTCNTCPTRGSTVQQPRKECKDELTACSDRRNLCTQGEPEVVKAMRNVCRKTCNACNEGVAVVAPPPTTTVSTPQQPVEITVFIPSSWTSTISPPCKDTSASCNALNQFPKFCEREQWKKRCPDTCKACEQQGLSATFPTVAPTQPPTPSPSVASVAVPCRDTQPDCPNYASLCTLKSGGSSWRKRCPFTCNACNEIELNVSPVTIAPPQTLAPVRPASTSGCEDSRLDCPSARQLCDEKDSGWPELCPKTCNVCPSAGSNIVQIRPNTQVASECKDTRTDCKELKALCGAPTSGWENYCPVTCNKCVPSDVTVMRPAVVTQRPEVVTVPAPTIAAPTQPPQIPPFRAQGGSQICKDNIPECSQFKQLCTQPGNTWRKDCPVTCNTCPTGSNRPQIPNQPSPTIRQQTLPPITQPTPTTTLALLVSSTPVATVGAPAVAGCVDEYEECDSDELREACTVGTEENVRIMRKVCPVTCNSCGEFVEEENTGECKDIMGECGDNVSWCSEGEASQVQTMREICPVTCGSCDEIAGSASVSGAGGAVVVPAQTGGSQISTDVWGEWSGCSVTCGAGFQTRNSICPKQGQSQCEVKQESVQCFGEPCPQQQPAVVAAAQVSSQVQICDKNNLDDVNCENLKNSMGEDVMCGVEALYKDCKKTCKMPC